jgi:hypothetical protein
MTSRRSIGLCIVLTFGSLVAVGCASAEEDTDNADGYLTPCSNPNAPGNVCPKTVDDQRTVCAERVKENGAFRSQDLDVGVLRWKCGDVQGVTKQNLGQEYCEFHAMQDGKVVDKTAKSQIKPANVECLFTGVFADVKGDAGTKANTDFGAKLNKALTEEANNLKNAKGVQLQAVGKNPLSVMNDSVNSRDAATTLLAACSASAVKPANASRINAADDTQKCGADGAGCASARDIEACTMVAEDDNGVGWRNSDPNICGRAARGALCGATFSPLPPALDGFLMTDWKADLGQAVKLWTGASKTAPSAPDGCRYATVDGKPYPHMMICTPTQSQVTNPKYEGQLQQMCSDVFGPSIAMTAPIGLVTKLGKDDSGFCGEFNKGARTLVSVASAK